MRFPSERERTALKRGADELMQLVEWHYRLRPAQLARLRKIYARVCVQLYRALERRFRSGRRK
jgi:hypothetical protein